ncbi:MAG: phosphoribosylglycinamide formyltransferase [Prevotellaceae bacterium]|jgi:phosphoribosylglycinamide formyltransferase-1|nr:phosphoribosylglycinamide formyltransferase [Prevotellaceae bacterium]
MTRIAIFASGNGSNFEAILRACQSGTVAAEVVVLLCDNPQAYVVERAKKHHIPTFLFDPKAYASKAACEATICAELIERQISLICLAGYMRIVGKTLLNAYPKRILNIHPSLLPAFKGAHAIDDAYAFGVKVFGVTVHLIDDTIDGGTIIAQRAFEYYGNDRNLIEARIHAIEHDLYPEAINLIIGD